MRSRYAAFALGKVTYLWETLHSSHDARQGTWEEFEASFGVGRRYEELRIVECCGPDVDGVARVLFVVRIRTGRRDDSFGELSFFAKEAGSWRYVDGIVVPVEEATTIQAIES